MQTITVNTAGQPAGRPYPIHIGSGLLPLAGEYMAAVCHTGRQVCIVTDSNVAPLYLKTVSDSLSAAGFLVESISFPAGEASKRLDTVAAIFNVLAAKGFTRSDYLVALGGGVVGDITGFAAATWMRGIGFVQIPTTLLAQVDSSVGGKTGVDIPQGKNLVGAFWQPMMVLADTDTLSTLPPDVFADGMGEVIKTACIKDAALFERLADTDCMNPANRGEVIARCVAIKARVVELDEREISGERKLLNFGHTLAHALEAYYHYEGLSHGRAVAVGMVQISAAAEQKGLTPPGIAEAIGRLLKIYGLPTTDPAPLSDCLKLMLSDKKRSGGKLDLVLLSQIGEAYVHTISIEELPAFFGVTQEPTR